MPNPLFNRVCPGCGSGFAVVPGGGAADGQQWGCRGCGYLTDCLHGAEPREERSTQANVDRYAPEPVDAWFATAGLWLPEARSIEVQHDLREERPE